MKFTLIYELMVCIYIHKILGVWYRISSLSNTTKLGHPWENTQTINTMHKCTNSVPLYTMSFGNERSSDNPEPYVWHCAFDFRHQWIKFFICAAAVEGCDWQITFSHPLMDSFTRDIYNFTDGFPGVIQASESGLVCLLINGFLDVHILVVFQSPLTLPPADLHCAAE